MSLEKLVIDMEFLLYKTDEKSTQEKRAMKHFSNMSRKPNRTITKHYKYSSSLFTTLKSFNSTLATYNNKCATLARTKQ